MYIMEIYAVQTFGRETQQRSQEHAQTAMDREEKAVAAGSETNSSTEGSDEKAWKEKEDCSKNHH